MVQNFSIVFSLWPLSVHSLIVLLKHVFYHISQSSYETTYHFITNVSLNIAISLLTSHGYVFCSNYVETPFYHFIPLIFYFICPHFCFFLTSNISSFLSFLLFFLPLFALSRYFRTFSCPVYFPSLVTHFHLCFLSYIFLYFLTFSHSPFIFSIFSSFFLYVSSLLRVRTQCLIYRIIKLNNFFTIAIFLLYQYFLKSRILSVNCAKLKLAH